MCVWLACANKMGGVNSGCFLEVSGMIWLGCLINVKVT
jgi:hypothetical protein